MKGEVNNGRGGCLRGEINNILMKGDINKCNISQCIREINTISVPCVRIIKKYFPLPLEEKVFRDMEFGS